MEIKIKNKSKSKNKTKKKNRNKNIITTNKNSTQQIRNSLTKVTNISSTEINRSSIKRNTNKSTHISSSKTKFKSKKKQEEKEIKIDNSLIKKQYKIIKEFLTPILKEEIARQLVSCYNKKISNEKSPILKRRKHCSLDKRAILDYSFLSENSESIKNRKKRPLFQILFPNQYKRHLEKINKNKIYKVNRPCRQKSTPNINNIIEKIGIVMTKFNKNRDKKKVNNIKNNKKVNQDKRSKTPPLYLRLNDIEKKHREEIEKLKKKFENNSNSKKGEIEGHKSRNRTQTKYDFESWYNFEKTWQKIKDIKLNNIRKEIEENEKYMKENKIDEETFKPKINKNSENIVNQKCNGDFYLRLKNYQNNKNKRAKILQKKLEPSFKPYINTNYKFKYEYYDYMEFDQKLINRDYYSFLNAH